MNDLSVRHSAHVGELVCILLVGMGCATGADIPPFSQSQAPAVFEELWRQAERGNTSAALELGRRYECGSGVKRNPVLSAKFYKIAALKRSGLSYIYTPAPRGRPGAVVATPDSFQYPPLSQANRGLRRVKRLGSVDMETSASSSVGDLANISRDQCE